MDFTVCVALDEWTVCQFEGVWPTWRHFKPQLLEVPWLVICDTNAREIRWWETRLNFHDAHRRELRPWAWGPWFSQRERMLTSLVHVPARTVSTAYWAKLDTDVVATGPEPWPLDDWLEGTPAIIGPPWGYTKPKPERGEWIERLDDWGDKIPELAEGPRLNQKMDKDGKIRHKRLVTWCSLIRTNFSYLCAQFALGRLPVPSEDTYHWYCAYRLQETMRPVKMQQHGWSTVSSDRRRAKLIKEVLAKSQGCCE